MKNIIKQTSERVKDFFRNSNEGAYGAHHETLSNLEGKVSQKDFDALRREIYEDWKDIYGYEGLYQVSNFGNVKSFKTGIEKPIKPTIDKRGYKHVTLLKEGKRKFFWVHRLVGMMFLSNPDNLPQINHINTFKGDNHYENLEWCDNSHNQLHAYRMGLQHGHKGETNGMAKLTHKEVKKIKELLKRGDMLQKEIASLFNVAPVTISHINNNRSWKHV